MKKILLYEDIKKEDAKEFLDKFYYNNDNSSLVFDFNSHFIDPMKNADKAFFEEVYKHFDGEKGSQHTLLMTELGELSCAFIDYQERADIFSPEYDKISEYEQFDEEENVSIEMKNAAKKLAYQDHIREEIADVLMLLYQYAVREKVDYKKSLSHINSFDLKKITQQSAFNDVLYKVSCFDHQLNRKERGRADYSAEQTKRLLISAILNANILGFIFDNINRFEPISQYEYVYDEKAKSVQEWFDFKVERTKKRMKEDKAKKFE